MKVIKLQYGEDHCSSLMNKLRDKGIQEGERFSISFKQGKKRKIKALRLISMGSHYCETCGGYTTLHLTRGKTDIFLDNHLGQSSIMPSLI